MTAAELARMWREERGRFADLFPRVRAAKLEIRRKPRGLPRRANAYADRVNRTVTIFASALATLRDRNLLGLVRHELGHLADPIPAAKDAEQRADDIAEAVTGQRIRYEGKHALQSVGRGVYPRPTWIHR